MLVNTSLSYSSWQGPLKFVYLGPPNLQFRAWTFKNANAEVPNFDGKPAPSFHQSDSVSPPRRLPFGRLPNFCFPSAGAMFRTFLDVVGVGFQNPRMNCTATCVRWPIKIQGRLRRHYWT